MNAPVSWKLPVQTAQVFWSFFYYFLPTNQKKKKKKKQNTNQIMVKIIIKTWNTNTIF